MEISRIRHESELALVEMQARVVMKRTAVCDGTPLILQAKLNAQDAMVSMLKDVDSSHRRSMSEM